jgi:lipopolysaccharide export system permease protein
LNTPLTFLRYLARVLVHWMLIVTLAIGSVIAIFDFTELFRRVATKNTVDVPLMLKMLALRFPLHIQEILPFIVLFAAIMTFWRLNRSSELIVMRASGLSIWQILFPMISLALVIGIGDLVFFSPFSAKLMNRYEVLENKFLNDRSSHFAIAETGLWLKEQYQKENRIIRVGHIDFDNKLLYNVTLYHFNPDNQLEQRLDANIASLDHQILKLKNVWRIKPGSVAQKIEKEQYHTSLNLQNIRDSFADPKTLPFWSLLYYSHLMEQSGLSGQRYLIHWHSLLAKCIWLAVMIVLAATFSLNPLRSKQAPLMLGLGVIASFILYFFRDMSTAMGLAGTIPSMLAAWAPTGVTALFAATKLLYSEDG